MPVIAVGVAAPQASASTGDAGGQPNSQANYYWSGVPGPDSKPGENDQTIWSSLYYTKTDAGLSSSAQFTTQISYRGDVPPQPPTPTLMVSVSFNHPVTVSGLAGGWSVDSTGPGTTFLFTKSAGTSQGSSLSFAATPSDGADVTALSSTATLSATNVVREDGSSATWTKEPTQASATERSAA